MAKYGQNNIEEKEIREVFEKQDNKVQQIFEVISNQLSYNSQADIVTAIIDAYKGKSWEDYRDEVLKHNEGVYLFNKENANDPLCKSTVVKPYKTMLSLSAYHLAYQLGKRDREGK